MNTKDLITKIAAGNTEESELVLNSILKDKVKTEIDLQRVKTAQTIFNNEDPVLEQSCKKTKKEVEDGNEFTKAAAKAVIDGEEEFEFDGKTYKATIDKEAAKKILGIKE